MKLFKLDKYTFGSSPACVHLVQFVLPKYPNIISKVSSLLCKYHETLNDMLYIKSPKTRMYMISLIANDYKKKVVSRNYPDEVKSYLINIISRQHKIWSRIYQKDTLMKISSDAKKRHVERLSLKESKKHEI